MKNQRGWPAAVIVVLVSAFAALTFVAGFNLRFLVVMAAAGCSVFALWRLAERGRPGRDPSLRSGFSIANMVALVLIPTAPLAGAALVGIPASPYTPTYWQGGTLMVLVNVLLLVVVSHRSGGNDRGGVAAS